MPRPMDTREFEDKIDLQKQNPSLTLTYNLDYAPETIWEIPTIFESTRALPFYVQEIGFTVAYDKYFVCRKGLESYMLCYITEGTMNLNYQNKVDDLSAGNLFWLDCTKEHKLSMSHKGSTLKCYWVHFFGNGAIQYKNQFDSLHGSAVLQLDAKSLILPYMQRLLDVYHKKEKTLMLNFEASSLLTSICYCLLEAVYHEQKETTPVVISKIKEYLTKNYAEDLTLEKLSQSFFLSKSYLQKQFKKYTGISPWDYLLQLRMTEGKRLLRTSDLSVHEIAWRVGFNDASYFVQVFRNLEKITPLQYRMLWTSNQLPFSN